MSWPPLPHITSTPWAGRAGAGWVYAAAGTDILCSVPQSQTFTPLKQVEFSVFLFSASTVSSRTCSQAVWLPGMSTHTWPRWCDEHSMW